MTVPFERSDLLLERTDAGEHRLEQGRVVFRPGFGHGVQLREQVGFAAREHGGADGRNDIVALEGDDRDLVRPLFHGSDVAGQGCLDGGKARQPSGARVVHASADIHHQQHYVGVLAAVQALAGAYIKGVHLRARVSGLQAETARQLARRG